MINTKFLKHTHTNKMIFIVYKCEYIYIKNVFTKNNVSYRTIFINFFFITKIPFTQDQQLSKKKMLLKMISANTY